MTLQLGLDTFGDVTERDGTPVHPAQAIRDVVEEAVLAEQAGVDFFGLGEHHRADFAVSSPEMVLAAIAARTSRIRLGSAVTVLSSDDPVRVHQRFATLDAVSSGRAEVILGRGSFTESFPLFGYPLDQYERLFDEKLDLFARLRTATGPVTWRGNLRPSLSAQEVHPPVEHGPLTTWIGVGGSPQSVVRAAHYRLPILLAIIGGDPARFRPYVDLYARALADRQQPMLPVGVHSPGYVGTDDASARDEFFPDYKRMHDRIGSTRGWPPLTRAQFDAEVTGGSLYVGGPETVARKIARTVQTLGLTRFQLKYSAGPLPHALLMGCIERYGQLVAPRVRALLTEGEQA